MPLRKPENTDAMTTSSDSGVNRLPDTSVTDRWGYVARLLRDRRARRNTLILLVPVVYLLGWWACSATATTGEAAPGVGLGAYRAAQLFLIGATGAPLEPMSIQGVAYITAMILAPVLIGGGIINIAGELLASLWSVQREIQQLNDHVIVCGLGTHGRGFIRRALAHDAPVAGVCLGHGDGSHAHFGRLDSDSDSGTRRVPVLHGDACDAGVLQEAGLLRARCIVFATSSALVNLKALGAARAAVKRLDPSKRPSMVLLHDGDDQDGLVDVLFGPGHNVLQVDRFNIASRVVEQLKAAEKSAVEPETIAVVGLGRLGSAAVTHILSREGAKRPTLLMVDPVLTDALADSENPKLKAAHSRAMQLVEDGRSAGWIVKTAGARGQDWVHGLEETELVSGLQVVVTIDDDLAALETAGSLRKRVAESRADVSVDVVLRVVDPGLAHGIQPDNTRTGVRIHVLGVEQLVMQVLMGKAEVEEAFRNRGRRYLAEHPEREV